MKIFAPLLTCVTLLLVNEAFASPEPERPFDIVLQRLAESDAVVMGDFRCSESSKRSAPAADEIAVRDVLTSLNDESVAIYRAAPDVFMFWIRLQLDLSLASMPTANHETLHYLNKQQRHCLRNSSLFVFDGKSYEIGIPRERTPNISVVVSEWPMKWISKSRNTRFHKYIIESSNFKDNNFYTLLDEWSAYIAGADLELKLLARYAPSVLPTGLRGDFALDGQISGAIEFTAFLIRYLNTINKHDSALHASILNDVGFGSLVCAGSEKLAMILENYSRLPVDRRRMILINSEILSDVWPGGASKIVIPGVFCGP
jgi:hypothetical protein